MSINPLHSLRLQPTQPDGSSTTLVAGLPTNTISRQMVVLWSHVPAHGWAGVTDATLVEMARFTRKANSGTQPTITIPQVEAAARAPGVDLDRTPAARIYALAPSTQERWCHERSKYIVEHWTGQPYAATVQVIVDAHEVAVAEHTAYRTARRNDDQLRAPAIHSPVPARAGPAAGVPPPGGPPPPAAVPPPGVVPPLAAADGAPGAPPAGPGPVVPVAPLAGGQAGNDILLQQIAILQSRLLDLENTRGGVDDHRRVSGGRQGGRARGRERSRSYSPARRIDYSDESEDYDDRRGGRRSGGSRRRR